ncbi:hypothetical protein RB653_009155 [Dictyostelium firmibasis]|uniref:Uncharacterized protein n=1 Tax=Dictyostelium firmibasis TaxID=79012 RepID=A0AAN7YX53_9MYCE
MSDDLSDFFAKKDSTKKVVKKPASTTPKVVVKPVSPVVSPTTTTTPVSPTTPVIEPKKVVDLSQLNKSKDTTPVVDVKESKTEQINIPTMRWADKNEQNTTTATQTKVYKNYPSLKKEEVKVEDDDQIYEDKEEEKEVKKEEENSTADEEPIKKSNKKVTPKQKKKSKQELEAEALMASLGITDEKPVPKPKKK